MTLSTLLVLGGLLAEVFAIFHLLRAKYPVLEPAAQQAARDLAPVEAIALLDDPPGRVRARLLGRLDRVCAWAFLVSGFALQLLSFLLRDSQRQLRWGYGLMLLGAIYLVGAGARFLIGVRYVHQVKVMLEARYQSHWKSGPATAGETNVGGDRLELLELQLRSLLSGYISDEELAYILDTYRFKIEETRKINVRRRQAES